MYVIACTKFSLSSSSARRRRQSPNYGEEIAFFNAGGGLTFTQPSVAPLNFAYTIDSTAAKAYQVLYNAYNGSVSPVASGLFVAGSSFWLTTVPDLFAALAVPISVHVDFFPVRSPLHYPFFSPRSLRC